MGLSSLGSSAYTALFIQAQTWPHRLFVALAALSAALSCGYSWKGLGWPGLIWLIMAALLRQIAYAFEPLTFSNLTRTLVYVTLLLAMIGVWIYTFLAWRKQKRANK